MRCIMEIDANAVQKIWNGQVIVGFVYIVEN